jgi:tetratricopeptide (TPR) repeat protein
MHRNHLSVFFSLILIFFTSVSLALAQESVKGSESSEAAVSDAVKTSGDEAADLDYMHAKELIYEQRFSEAVPYLEKALKRDPKSPHLNNELSKAYAQTGEFDKAVTTGKKAVELEPKKVDYRFNLAEAFTANKNYNAAREQYEISLELDPTNQRAGLLIAMLHSEMGDDTKAIEQLTKLIKENGESPLALFYRARIYIEKNQIEEAKADLEQCLQQRPSFVEAGTALGLIFEKNGEVDEAIRVYSKIQGSGQFKKRLAFLFIQKNQLKQALECLSEYEEMQPDDYTARVKLGLLYFELKNYDTAKEKFLKILKEQPSSDNVRFYLGWVFQAQKQWNPAIEQFKKVTKDSTLFQEAMLHVGYIYRESNRINDGLSFSKELLRKNKDVPEFYDLRASLFESNKNYKDALIVLEEGLKQIKDDEKLLYFKGALLDKTGKSAEALKIMKGLVEKNPQHAHALNFIAYYYADRGENLVEAEEKANKALSIRPDDGYITDTLAWVKFKKGEYEAALEKLQKAAELIPEEAIIYDHFGDVYSAKQEKEKAISSYKKAGVLSKGKDKELFKKVAGKVTSLENPVAAAKKDDRIPSAEKK